MEIYFLVLKFVGYVLLGTGFGTLLSDKRWGTLVSVFVGIVLILVSGVMTHKEKPSSLNILTTGEKYEVVAICEKYIVTKPVTNKKQLRFIGPTNVVSLAVGGIYIKTAEGNLEKLE